MNFLGILLEKRGTRAQRSVIKYSWRSCHTHLLTLSLFINHIPAQLIPENSRFRREPSRNCLSLHCSFLWHWETMYDYNKNPFCEKIQVICFCFFGVNNYLWDLMSWGMSWLCTRYGEGIASTQRTFKVCQGKNKFCCQFLLKTMESGDVISVRKLWCPWIVAKTP